MRYQFEVIEKSTRLRRRDERKELHWTNLVTGGCWGPTSNMLTSGLLLSSETFMRFRIAIWNFVVFVVSVSSDRSISLAYFLMCGLEMCDLKMWVELCAYWKARPDSNVKSRHLTRSHLAHDWIVLQFESGRLELLQLSSSRCNKIVFHGMLSSIMRPHCVYLVLGEQ